MELTQAVLDRIVTALFPEQPGLAHEALARYGRPGIDREILRVRVAALRVSEGNLAALEKAIGAALVDYRDVLAWAEYPVELISPTWNMPPGDVTRIRTADRLQYHDWLARFAAPADPPPP